jgi:23S rRNA (adenine2030-N6)-methyltransferase
MNYRHAFHAGNHADVFKHAALALVLEHLCAKLQPFAVLDTHAGIGVYDLTSDEARRSPEFEGGIARIFGQALAAAPAYSRLVHDANPEGLRTYPGSPEIIRALLRPEDRLIACELHPEDAQVLKTRYRDDRRVGVHHRDGYEAMGALLPPPERRGLVFIDPPFEKTDETDRLVRALSAGLKRWPTGIFAAWYPIKDRKVSDALSAAAAETPWPKALRAELVPFAWEENSLPGSGLLICNAPWKLDEKLAALCEELAARLGGSSARWSVDQLTPA